MTELMVENDVIIEKNVKETVTDPAAGNIDAAGAKPPPINVETRKKKRGGFGIFRAALSMLRKRPGEKGGKKSITKQNSTASNANWTKLVGSMRPLCLQETPESPTVVTARPLLLPVPADETVKEIIKLEKQPSEESMEEMFPPASPFASSSSCTMSQYSSAVSLRDLDNCSEDEDPDEVFDAITGDEMIDAKAEEFIAQFYRQIQLQNTSYHPGDRGI